MGTGFDVFLGIVPSIALPGADILTSENAVKQ